MSGGQRVISVEIPPLWTRLVCSAIPKQAPVRSFTCQKRSTVVLQKKTHFFLLNPRLLKDFQRRDGESFAFTSNVDDCGGRGSKREREGGRGRVEVKLFLVEETLISSGVAERETDLVG